MLEHHQGDPDFLRLLMYLALENHSLAQIFWDKNVRVLYEFLGGYIRRRQEEGAFRAVEPYAAVRVFVGAIIHHSLVNLLWDKDPARRILNVPNVEAARQFADVFLRGVEAAGPDAAARNNAGGEDVKNIDTQDDKN
jgi:hypothetical protein